MSFSGKTIVIMGLAPGSIAIAIGRKVAQHGCQVIYSVQSDRHLELMKRRGFTPEERYHVENSRVIACDVTDHGQIKSFAAELSSVTGPISGLVHSLAFANKDTMLGDDLFNATQQDVANAVDISAASLIHVVRYMKDILSKPASVVTLTFESQRVLPGYGWMHMCKSSLEAAVRGLAYQLGSEGVRVNAISAGPLDTMSAKAIPGFEKILEPWNDRSPLGWDYTTGRRWIAQTTCDLLWSLDGVTGQVLKVDGGFHLSMF